MIILNNRASKVVRTGEWVGGRVGGQVGDQKPSRVSNFKYIDMQHILFQI